MNNISSQLAQLFSVRNQYGENFSRQKINLLASIRPEAMTSKKDIQICYDNLLFLLAFPDNRAVLRQAKLCLQQLESFIHSNEQVRNKLYNSGITKTQVCAAFSFELVKWLRKNLPGNIRLNWFDSNDGKIQSILCAVIPKVESEILQDANSDWKTWVTKSLQKKETLLDGLIRIFEEADIRPEVKDELWTAIGINVEIDFPEHVCLPAALYKSCFHRSLLKKNFDKKPVDFRKIKLSGKQAEAIIMCSRMILVRHLREIDPITFTTPQRVAYYQLSRGLSIALMGMTDERRHPIDCYMGYVVFKNGLPVAYAGSWILFDSGRIGLNVFPSYRGGESQYIFDQVCKIHSKVYQLKRLTVDPYQLGKENEDGIHSGAFWVYYHAGFRPVKNYQRQLAETEAMKAARINGYRSSFAALRKLADSRMEMVLQKNAVKFDATDLSIAYAEIIRKGFHHNRKLAEETCFKKLADRLKIKNWHEEKMKFVLKNWSVLLMSYDKLWRNDSGLKNKLKKIFELKAYGREEDYMKTLQQTPELRTLLELAVKENKEDSS
jgi:hypothetical protein